MIDPFEYEARLQARLTAHAARAARPFDAAAIAASAAAGSPRDRTPRQFGRLLAGRNGRVSAPRVALVGLLLLAAVGAGTIFIGSVFQPRPPLPEPLVEIGPSASPSASASIGPTDVAIRGSWVANALPLPSLQNGARARQPVDRSSRRSTLGRELRAWGRVREHVGTGRGRPDPSGARALTVTAVRRASKDDIAGR